MAYNVLFHKKVEKFLNKHSDIKIKVLLSFKQLSTSPYENNLDIRPLKGYKNHFRLRIGKYRFLYEIIEKELFIFTYDANSRGDIY